MPCDTTQRAWWCTWGGSTNPRNTSTADRSTSRIHSAPKIYQCVICRTKLCTRVLFIVCIFCTEIKQRKKKPNTSVRFTYIHTKTTGYRMTNNESYRLKTHLLFIAKKNKQNYSFLPCESNTNILHFVLWEYFSSHVCWPTSQHNGPPLPRIFQHNK